jgi:hypothetical protein
MDIRLKEHQWHIRLEHPDKSAISEHSINQGHYIQFHNSSITAMKTRYMDCIVSEAIQIELHPYNINREGGFCLSNSWKPFIGSLKTFGTGPRSTWWCSPLSLNPALLTVNPSSPKVWNLVLWSGHLKYPCHYLLPPLLTPSSIWYSILTF